MNVVLPEDDGPATSTNRTRLDSCATRSAMPAIFFSWKPSAMRICSEISPERHIRFREPTLARPSSSFHRRVSR
jgi:hypothetical protein